MGNNNEALDLDAFQKQLEESNKIINKNYDKIKNILAKDNRRIFKNKKAFFCPKRDGFIYNGVDEIDMDLLHMHDDYLLAALKSDKVKMNIFKDELEKYIIYTVLAPVIKEINSGMSDLNRFLYFDFFEYYLNDCDFDTIETFKFESYPTKAEHMNIYIKNWLSLEAETKENKNEEWRLYSKCLKEIRACNISRAFELLNKYFGTNYSMTEESADTFVENYFKEHDVEAFSNQLIDDALNRREGLGNLDDVASEQSGYLIISKRKELIAQLLRGYVICFNDYNVTYEEFMLNLKSYVYDDKVNISKLPHYNKELNVFVNDNNEVMDFTSHDFLRSDLKAQVYDYCGCKINPDIYFVTDEMERKTHYLIDRNYRVRREKRLNQGVTPGFDIEEDLQIIDFASYCYIIDNFMRGNLK